MRVRNFFFLLVMSLLYTARAYSVSPVDSTTLDASLHVGGYTSNLTLDSNKIYILKGYLFIQSGANITIPSGTIIRGDQATKGCLIINRGGKIFANGTATRPVIFTSRFPKFQRNAGDWGGVILVGKATINTYPGTDTAIVEGVVPDLYYGGHDDADNSGAVHYLRVEYAGIALSPNNEINGFTMYSVGTGTVLDHIMVSYAGDDSFEWFGGTVKSKYLIAFNTLDDCFDDSFGFRGAVQYALSVRNPGIADVSGSKVWESDNNEFVQGTATVFNANNPRTRSIFANITSIGPKEFDTTTISPNYTTAIHERRWSLRACYDGVFMGWNKGYRLDGVGCVSAAAGDTIKFISNILAGISGNNWDTVSAGGQTLNPTTWGMDPARLNDTLALNTQVQLNNPYNPVRQGSNYMPQNTSSPVYTHVTTNLSAVDPFFENTTYRGAFGTTDWTAGWANWRPDSVDYDNIPPIGIQNISTTVPKSYTLEQNYPNPFNPQTIIKFNIVSSGLVTLKIYDILGREVRTLANNEAVNPGTYKVDFNASDLPSGVYFYKLAVNAANVEWNQTRKMILVK